MALSPPVRAMSYTVVHRTRLDTASCETQGLVRVPFEQGLFKTTAASATLQSGVIETPAPFDDLVGSWNAKIPPLAGLKMQARVLVGSEWSGWFDLAAVGKDGFESVEKQENDFGFVDVDTLKLKKPAKAFRYRFLLSAPSRAVVLRLAAMTVSNAEVPDLAPFQPGPWVTELKARPRSQTVEQEKYKHDICSPTSLSMVLEFWGDRLPTVEVAERVRDQKTAIFGHWPFNAAVAGDLGLESYVARLDGMEDLQEEIAQGRPVVVSLTYGEGELKGSPIKKTKGHLLVVAGFDFKGDVIALDPAAPPDSVRRVYDRKEFWSAWRLKKRGLAYLVGPLKGRKLTVGVPVMDLMAKARQRKKVELDDPEHLSQLLYGERVTVTAVKAGWVHVLADEQLDFFEDDKWEGYPGWIDADSLMFDPPPKPNVLVRTKQALVQRGSDMMLLSVGTRLLRVSQDKDVSTLRLLDGTTAEIASDALTSPPEQVSDESRAMIIKTSELFLGTSYYWGGRSGVEPDLSVGVDCSGLVSLSYRMHGMDIPRDSHEQKLKAKPIDSKDMKPADLVFLTEPGDNKRITHVMIFTGGDGVIESRKSSGRVLRSSFKERFGKTLLEIKSGDEVTDLSFSRPKKRLIYFGSYF
ncbi:MAG: C39 family peptidase [Elusimicrobia bacterium]|nr:C39 family peptidase [Elusimicrobiota bacterium]